MNKIITDEELLAELAGGSSSRVIAEKFGIHKRSVEKRKSKLRTKGLLDSPTAILKGTSTLYDADGNIKVQWVKTKASKQQTEEQEKELLDAFIEKLPQLEAIKLRMDDCVNSSLMAVYPLGDPHVGMLAWAEETQENWDLAIAEQVLCSGFARAVSKAPKCKLGVILNLGDFFHYDNLAGITERSRNVLDKDGRYAKMVKVGIKIIRQMIETALTHHEKVRVINCVGNHDETGSLFFSLCLSHIYENEPRVEVETAPTPAHYVRFGKVLIGAHHGHTMKKEMLPGIMAADKASDWGETEYRYWMTGHIHHDSTKEYPGCKVESFRTLAAQDSYAAWHGYRSGRDTKVIVFHKDYGEIERYTVSIDQLI